MKQLRFVWIFLACAVSVFAQKGGFTLEQVMSSPFPTGLTAAAKANRVAWVFNAKGERNVWIADSPKQTAYLGKFLFFWGRAWQELVSAKANCANARLHHRVAPALLQGLASSRRSLGTTAPTIGKDPYLVAFSS